MGISWLEFHRMAMCTPQMLEKQKQHVPEDHRTNSDRWVHIASAAVMMHRHVFKSTVAPMRPMPTGNLRRPRQPRQTPPPSGLKMEK